MGQDVFYVSLTPRDLEPLGVFTARALLPDFQPIWFGSGERRLGRPASLRTAVPAGPAGRARRPRLAQSAASPNRLRAAVMFRADHPLAWTFHRGTSRWL